MKRFLCGLVGVLIGTLVCGCGSYERKEPKQGIDTAMGTIVSQTLYGEEADEALTEIVKLIEELEYQKLSRRVESAEIYRINQQAGAGAGITVSQEMSELLQECLAVSAASKGAFDITIGEAVRLWDIDTWAGMEDITNYPLPEEEEIRRVLVNTGYEHLALENDVLHLPTGMQLDLGAVGKGVALDEIKAYLEQTDSVECGVISVGGSVLTYGTKADNTPWRVGVVNPSDTSSNLGYLELKGEWCVSTSGDYERYVEVEGNRYHHIIDPATGYPADSGLRSVTILAKNGLLSDALSTACFIVGPEAGMELAEHFCVEAVMVEADGKVIMTPGMEQYFHLSK